MKIKLVETDTELEQACRVMNELRTMYSFDELLERMKMQLNQGYQVVFAEENGNVVGVAGFVITNKLAWDKHVYVDDLVVSENIRSTGVGNAILDWVEEYGKENNCTQLHLDSGVQRFDAHRFYLKRKFVIASHHFSKNI